LGKKNILILPSGFFLGGNFLSYKCLEKEHLCIFSYLQTSSTMEGASFVGKIAGKFL